MHAADSTQSVSIERATKYARYAWFVLLYNLPIIMIGAFVRATRAGDGCGNHWPLCNGEVLPIAGQVKTLIEFTHRITSGIDGPLVLALLVGAFRVFPRGHRVRYAAVLVFLFTGIEAWLGRALVLNGWVVDDVSVGRAIAMSLHLANTFFLLAALTATAWWASGGEALRLRGQGAFGWAIGGALFSALLLGISGAITALGDTLFPVTSASEAIQQSLAPGAHFLVKLRILHPLIAVTVGLYLVLVAGLANHLRPSPQVRHTSRLVTALFGVEIGAGLLNKILLAPVWMQLVHLLLADLMWISLIALSMSAFALSVKPAELSASTEDVLAGQATWRDYLVLTKPRVISLLLFTALAAMFIAKGGWPGIIPFLAVALGGYAAAGAANSINMVIDRDIDRRMARTATRPTVTQRIPPRRALLFGFGLALVSFGVLWAAANLLSAMLALAGLVFYVVIYTLMLKRRTWHNIVIGGAAGAFPPLVGWAAVTNDLSPLAWTLFAIVFVWTPVHFWALAMLIKDDYAEAGVPMLPVVRGDRATVKQIAAYTVVTVAVSLLPFFWHMMGVLYLCAALMLNAFLVRDSLRLYLEPGQRRRASSLFHYSMLYLALLFLGMAVDRAIFL